MFALTLRNADDKRTLGSRNLQADGIVRVGRDPSADWVIDDRECWISRHHLDLRLCEGLLSLRAIGVNGVEVGEPPRKVRKGEEVPLSAGECVRLGAYTIEVSSHPASAEVMGAVAETSSAPTASAEMSSASALTAFCEGAQIHPSQIIAEDPAALMRQAGAVYRAMIDGLDDLLADRSEFRDKLAVDRTTISGSDNNLLKWAPAQRRAVDLLLKKDAAFISGADAIAASISDLRDHNAGLVAGCERAVERVLELLRPAELEATAGRRGLLDRTRAAWDRFLAVYAELEQERAGNAGGAVQRAFQHAYAEAAGNRPDRA